jgi:putative transposase
MKGQDLQNLLVHFSITKSNFRFSVSNNNAYSEFLFKTLKYTNDFPARGFDSIEVERTWVNKLVDFTIKNLCVVP